MVRLKRNDRFNFESGKISAKLYYGSIRPFRDNGAIKNPG